jgi:hypothetical protein
MDIVFYCHPQETRRRCDAKAFGYQYIGCIGLSGLGFLRSFALQLCRVTGFETVGNLADFGYVSY